MSKFNPFDAEERRRQEKAIRKAFNISEAEMAEHESKIQLEKEVEEEQEDEEVSKEQ